MVITLDRTCGSKGGKIAKMLAEKFGYTYVDHDYLIEKAKDSGRFDELVHFFSGPPGSYFYSLDFGSAETSEQAEFLSKLRKFMPKDNMIVVGCCGNHLLRKEGAFTIFISADTKDQIEIVQKEVSKIDDADDARDYIQQVNGRRRLFHEAFTGENWESPKNYDLCLNVSAFGLDSTVEIIEKAIEASEKEHE